MRRLKRALWRFSTNDEYDYEYEISSEAMIFAVVSAIFAIA